MNFIMTESQRDKILKDLRLLKDEPKLNDFDDDFGLSKLAKRLTDILLSTSTPTPFTIGINGEWGSGKTSLINDVCKRIKSKEDKNIETAIYNAWEYEGKNTSISLLQCIGHFEKDEDRKKKVH